MVLKTASKIRKKEGARGTSAVDEFARIKGKHN